MGLIPALRWLADRLAFGDGLQTELCVTGGQRQLSTDVELTLFRIAQEMLSNVRKHAEASAAMVLLEFGEQRVTMSVSDNGRGFELPPTENHFVRQGKHGLMGIIERVRLNGGSHKIESALGKGTTLKVEIAAMASSWVILAGFITSTFSPGIRHLYSV